MQDMMNVWAVLAAAIASMILGGLWYSPLLFANAWMRASGVTEEKAKNGEHGRSAWGRPSCWR